MWNSGTIQIGRPRRIQQNQRETHKPEPTETEPKRTSTDDPVGSVRIIRCNPSWSWTKLRGIGTGFDLNLVLILDTNEFTLPFLHSSCKPNHLLSGHQPKTAARIIKSLGWKKRAKGRVWQQPYCFQRRKHRITAGNCMKATLAEQGTTKTERKKKWFHGATLNGFSAIKLTALSNNHVKARAQDWCVVAAETGRENK